VTDLEDDGHAISFQVLPRGTPVRSADGVQLGTVRRVHEAKREHIFDGIDVDTPDGLRFLDAPEVARIAERWVTTTFPAAEKEEHLVARPSRLSRMLGGSTTARRAKRTGESLRERWDRR
jgi:hypothetical protein